jgi:hypothetical protein
VKDFIYPWDEKDDIAISNKPKRWVEGYTDGRETCVITIEQNDLIASYSEEEQREYYAGRKEGGIRLFALMYSNPKVRPYDEWKPKKRG